MLRPIAAAYREAFSGLSRSVWLLSIATLINRSGTMVLPFLALFLTEKRGFTTRRNPLKVSGVGAFLFCAGFALLPLGSGFGFVVFTVVIWTVGEMLVFPIVASAVADRAPEESRGSTMGLLNLSFATSFVVAPLVGTWIYQNLGPQALWYGCGVVGLVVWAGFQAVAIVTTRPVLSPLSPGEGEWEEAGERGLGE